MEFKRLTDLQHPQWDDIWNLYLTSFPLCEQRSLPQHILALEDPDFHADIIEDDGQFIGLVFYWDWDNYRFIEHLVTTPAVRGGGYGARIMEAITSNDSRLVLLEIDPPTDSIAIRREGFYQRCGFVTNPYHHIHPSFRPSTTPHELLIMSYPRMLTAEEFAEFRRYTFQRILTYSDLEDLKQ